MVLSTVLLNIQCCVSYLSSITVVYFVILYHSFVLQLYRYDKLVKLLFFVLLWIFILNSFILPYESTVSSLNNNMNLLWRLMLTHFYNSSPPKICVGHYDSQLAWNASERYTDRLQSKFIIAIFKLFGVPQKQRMWQWISNQILPT